jgi:hypothetical protein
MVDVTKPTTESEVVLEGVNSEGEVHQSVAMAIAWYATTFKLTEERWRTALVDAHRISEQ